MANVDGKATAITVLTPLKREVGVQDGTAPRKMTVPGDPPFLLGPLSRVVTVKGGEYFFVPGINGLHFLTAAAGGDAA